MANFNFNKVILGGRLTADPELKQTPQGTSVTSFSIAVNRNYRNGDNTTTADFINCVAWRSNAEFISRYFKKGSSICVTGSIQTRTWNDQNGQKRYATEVVIDEATFVDSRKESGYTPSENNAPAYSGTDSNDNAQTPTFEELSNDDDLPF